jgi:hypothetical protein
MNFITSAQDSFFTRSADLCYVEGPSSTFLSIFYLTKLVHQPMASNFNIIICLVYQPPASRAEVTLHKYK